MVAHQAPAIANIIIVCMFNFLILAKLLSGLTFFALNEPRAQSQNTTKPHKLRHVNLGSLTFIPTRTTRRKHVIPTKHSAQFNCCPANVLVYITR